MLGQKSWSSGSGAQGRAGVAAVCAALAGMLLAPAALAHRVEKRFAVELRPVVAIQNDLGRITVKSWNRQEVYVIADHASDKVEVDAEQMGGRIEITTHTLTKNLPLSERKADFEIMVPEETELQVKNDAGNIVVERVSGDLTFETVVADVRLQEVYGYIVVKTVGGSLVCVRCAGRLEANSISGNLRFEQVVSNNVFARTYSGSIFFDGDILPSGSYNLRSTEGPIEILFTSTDSFDLRASSLRGKVERDKGLQLKPPARAHGSLTLPSATQSSFTGVQGTGQARVELTSFSGTITIRKRD